jgi:hypothetical protein
MAIFCAPVLTYYKYAPLRFSKITIFVTIIRFLKHFQQKCEAVLRGIMRKNKELERLHDPMKIGTALRHCDIVLNIKKPAEKRAFLFM